MFELSSKAFTQIGLMIMDFIKFSQQKHWSIPSTQISDTDTDNQMKQILSLEIDVLFLDNNCVLHFCMLWHNNQNSFPSFIDGLNHSC
jgi:hypothetical protein